MLTRSWCARCNRRRVFPPECQRRQQFGASGDRASPPNRPRSTRHRPRHATRRATRRADPRRNPGASGAVADVPEGDVAAAGRAATTNGGRAARIRTRRGASGVAGAARLRRPARRPLPRRPDRGGIPNRRRGFRGELRHRHRGRGRVGVDAAPAQPGRPHPGAVDVGDGKPCRASHSAGATSGPAASTSPGSRRRRAMWTATAVVAGRQADRRVRRPARAGEACRAARRTGCAATTCSS